MFKFKRLVSSAVASVMALTIMATTSFAAVPSDVVGTKYEEPAQVLGALEIMVGDHGTGAFRPEDSIIRSEVSKVAVAALGLTNVADMTNGPTIYPDVVSNHWANGFINVATSQKLVIGDDVGTFRPDDAITYAEAVTILVRALGYENRAIKNGGFPTGFIVTGSSIGLTKGVSGLADEVISRGDVARLTFNALTIKLMEQVGYGDNERYEVVDKTLLSDNLGITKIEGQVTAVGGSALSGSSTLKADEIIIGGKTYNSGKADVSQVLGFNVTAYVDEELGNRSGTTILVLPDSSMNTSITVNADNIESVVNETDEKVLNYWVNQETDKKVSKANIKTDAIVMYNGRLGSFDDFKKIESGSIALLDTENAGKYNIVFVNEAENYVVNEISVSGNKITDKYGKPSLVLDPEDDSLTFIIERGAEKLNLEDLKEWDVLQVMQSKDKEFVKIIVSNDKVEGKVTEKEDGKYFINGKGYKKAANYTAEIKLGDEGIFYLDPEGKIAAAQSQSVISDNYAYITDIAVTGQFGKGLSIKLFTKDGETKVFEGASKIRVNNQTNLSDQAVIDALKGNGESATGQLITFETNVDGQIYKMTTANVSADINEDVFTLNHTEKGMIYKNASKKLIGATKSVNVNANTLVFAIPEGETDSKEYTVEDITFFANDDSYDVTIYDMDESMTAKVVIVSNAVSKISEESAIAVVDRITLTENDAEEDIEKLYAFQNGEAIEVPTAEAGILVKGEDQSKKYLQQGDIIQFNKNSKGEITSVKVLFDINTKGTETQNKDNDTVTMYGKVVNKFDGSFNIQVNGSQVQNLSIGDAKIYKVDTTKTKNQVTLGDASDIQKYDEANGERVFVRIYKDVVKEIVVIK